MGKKKKKRLTQEISITDCNFSIYYTVTRVHIMAAFLDFKCNETGGRGVAIYNQSFILLIFFHLFLLVGG